MWWVVALLGCVVAYLAIGSAAAPGGPVFAVECVILAGIAGGQIVDWVNRKSGARLPPLLGMLIAGCCLRNAAGVRVDKRTSSSLRTAALSLILCRAGLGLDTEALRRLRWAAFRLAALPCLVEATVAAILGFLLFSLPAPWCATLGFVVAAVSPAVVVPSLVDLDRQGYGTKTGIPTLVVAAAALDDVFSLAGFGVSLGFALDTSDRLPAWSRAPLELFLGATVGSGAALALRYASTEDIQKRAAALGVAALAATFGLKHLGFSGASALATLALATIAARDWGRQSSDLVGARFSRAWTLVAQPALFSLLGVAVDLGDLPPRTAALAVLLVVVGAAFRLGATAAAVAPSLPRTADRLFVALAWLPKATVQAAVGAVPLDAATTDTQENRARIILAVSVIAIILTAPLGAVAISVSGPKLLQKEEPAVVLPNDDDDDNNVLTLRLEEQQPQKSPQNDNETR
ncbi:hypothetical protein CTAYLR_009950 [Chrysophaeum taylorii]|uniref:Cation/H+ exchanger transmembrane domain-containing protein n=1 Tax=Chrysophaeum taylorii TaxID=2483200 RepID=A0AAD7UI76_9STRA|nr:hypothetical protein CTAYLR_009950 [Chrysophaeum taylorii]